MGGDAGRRKAIFRPQDANQVVRVTPIPWLKQTSGRAKMESVSDTHLISTTWPAMVSPHMSISPYHGRLAH